MTTARFPHFDELKALERQVANLVDPFYWDRNGSRTPMGLRCSHSEVIETNHELATIRREMEADPTLVIGTGWPDGLRETIESIATTAKRLTVRWEVHREPSASAMFNGDLSGHPDPVLEEEELTALKGALAVLTPLVDKVYEDRKSQQ